MINNGIVKQGSPCLTIIIMEQFYSCIYYENNTKKPVYNIGLQILKKKSNYLNYCLRRQIMVTMVVNKSVYAWRGSEIKIPC